MATTIEGLAKYVQGDLASDAAYLQQCVTEGTELVTHRIADNTVPPSVIDRATLEVAADLYYRRRSRNGISTFDGSDGMPEPMRISRNPMLAAQPILAPYLGMGIA